MPSRQQQNLIAGHESKSGGLRASTVAHIFTKSLFDHLYPDVAASTYKFNSALDFLENNGRDRLVVVKLLGSLREIISGGYTLEKDGDATDVITSFPLQVLKVKDLPPALDDVEAAQEVLAGLAEEGFDCNTPETFVVSCHVVRFWFDDDWCKFTGRPASTFLNQRTHNKVQLGGAVASIFPSFARMTREALENYGSTQDSALRETNRGISYPDTAQETETETATAAEAGGAAEDGEADGSVIGAEDRDLPSTWEEEVVGVETMGISSEVSQGLISRDVEDIGDYNEPFVRVDDENMPLFTEPPAPALGVDPVEDIRAHEEFGPLFASNGSDETKRNDSGSQEVGDSERYKRRLVAEEDENLNRVKRHRDDTKFKISTTTSPDNQDEF